MNNPEFEMEELQSKDRNGYSEKQTDLQIDKKSPMQNVKQFNRLTNQTLTNNTVVILKKQKVSSVIFDSKISE